MVRFLHLPLDRIYVRLQSAYKYEWNICLECEKCGRKAYKYLATKYKEKRALGCKECGLHTEVEMKDSKLTIGQLKISIYVPCYY